MKVTVVKHHARYTQEMDCPSHLKTYQDLLGHHQYLSRLFDRDDFQPHPLVTDVTVHKYDGDSADDDHAAFWVTITLGGDTHDVLCWTIIDLFELFDLFKLLPNV